LLAVLDTSEEELEIIRISDPHLLREQEVDKLGILDIKVKSAEGVTINIEIQVSPVNFLISRMEWYNAKMLTGQMKISDTYEKVG
jgi:predicted transposase/invertase (TIGR01784 family)